MKRNIYFSRFSRWSFDTQRVPGSLAVKGGTPLIKAFIKIALIIGGKVTPSVVRVIIHYLNAFKKLMESGGIRFLVLYTKTCSVMIQQSLAGHIEKDLTPIAGVRVSRTKKGLPRVIPSGWRKQIMKGNWFYARLTLTLLAIFRILVLPGTLKISTITKPFTGQPMALTKAEHYANRFISLVLAQTKVKASLSFLPSATPFPIFKRAPHSKEVGAFSTNPVVITKSLWGLERLGLSTVWIHLAQIIGAYDLISLFRHCKEWSQGFVSENSTVGKLGVKLEAAGKVRVFAMVDPWTQWILNPIHKKIFQIIGRLPMDGTFNQSGVLKRTATWKSMFSLDLSSATDRLPVSVQEMLLKHLFGNNAESARFASLWRSLLVDREYLVPKGHKDVLYPDNTPDKVKYAVGQPMGALSSWAMLAFTHHFIVQWAAWQIGKVDRHTLYDGYIVLGDDIVIRDPEVASSYLSVLKDLGVECGLHKSVLSPKGYGLEFAKRTIIQNNDISPVTLLELSSSLMTIPQLVSLGKKYNLKPATVLSVAGFGYKVLAKVNSPFYRMSGKLRDFMLMWNFPHDMESLKKFWTTRSNLDVDLVALIDSFRSIEFSRMAETTKVLWDLVESKFYQQWMEMAVSYAGDNEDLKDLYHDLQLAVFYSMLKKLEVELAFLYRWFVMTVPSYKFRSQSPYEIWKAFLNSSSLLSKIPIKLFTEYKEITVDRAKRLYDVQFLKIWRHWAPSASALAIRPNPTDVSVNVQALESSLFGLALRGVRRLVLINSTVQQSLIHRSFSKVRVPMRSFGLRTLVALWIGEFLFISFFGVAATFILQFICWIIPLIWNGSFQFSLISVPVAQALSNALHSLYLWIWGTNISPDGGNFGWISIIDLIVGSFILNISFHLREILDTILVNSLSYWEIILASGSIVYTYTVYPILQLIMVPVGWWFSQGTVWELMKCSTIVQTFDYFIHSIIYWMWFDFTVIFTGISPLETISEVEELDWPYDDQGRLITSDESTTAIIPEDLNPWMYNAPGMSPLESGLPASEAFHTPTEGSESNDPKTIPSLTCNYLSMYERFQYIWLIQHTQLITITAFMVTYVTVKVVAS